MSIKVGNSIIETDEEGYLINPDDWSEAVAIAMAAKESGQEQGELSETHLGLVQYFREYYAENKVHPTMRTLVMTLGKHHGRRFHEHKDYERFLYDLFPNGPIPELCKLAGLPKPPEALAG